MKRSNKLLIVAGIVSLALVLVVIILIAVS